MSFETRNFIRLSQKAIPPFLIAVIIGYFVYHSIQGNRGILAWCRLNDRLHAQTEVLDQLVKECQTLETKITCMRPESLDRDLLEQQVRCQLGYTHPDEVVILALEGPSKK